MGGIEQSFKVHMRSLTITFNSGISAPKLSQLYYRVPGTSALPAAILGLHNTDETEGFSRFPVRPTLPELFVHISGFSLRSIADPSKVPRAPGDDSDYPLQRNAKHLPLPG